MMGYHKVPPSGSDRSYGILLVGVENGKTENAPRIITPHQSTLKCKVDWLRVKKVCRALTQALSQNETPIGKYLRLNA